MCENERQGSWFGDLLRIGENNTNRMGLCNSSAQSEQNISRVGLVVLGPINENKKNKTWAYGGDPAQVEKK